VSSIQTGRLTPRFLSLTHPVAKSPRAGLGEIARRLVDHHDGPAGLVEEMQQLGSGQMDRGGGVRHHDVRALDRFAGDFARPLGTIRPGKLHSRAE